MGSVPADGGGVSFWGEDNILEFDRSEGGTTFGIPYKTICCEVVKFMVYK